MNISEFERTKPKETYKSITDSIKKYKKIIESKHPPMDDEDAIAINLCEEFITNLINIKNNLKEGK
tara:strand:- start:16 stop:213 length:198 start_codon:yes stop_codon:yes gene_type:complete